MKRKIIKIDESKCNGCGLCVNACNEGALGIIDGKAKLLREDYCDGLGNCLPACPVDAISFEEREAPEFDKDAVDRNQKMNSNVHHGCPGSRASKIKRQSDNIVNNDIPSVSQLNQWPVQIKLVPFNAPYFNKASLLIAADCTAYAYAGFHKEFMRNKITLIGCPKLDSVDYTDKLTEIIKNNDIKSVTVVRMEVMCCSGIEHATVNALKNSGKYIPWQVVTITTDGFIKETD